MNYNEKEIFSLSYLPLFIKLRCLETAYLPPYLGSALHGIVGWALQPHKNAYQYLYENHKQKCGKNVVNPYFIDTPRCREVYVKGEYLCFQFVLIGHGSHYAEEVINALTENKILEIGASRKKFELVEILHGEDLSPIWQLEKLHYEALTVKKIGTEGQKGIKYCSIHLLTPLRIRRGGQLVTEVEFVTIIRNITRRMTELVSRYGGMVDLEEVEKIIILAERVRKTSSGLYKNEMERYSSRREEKMDFSGMLGALTFEGELTPFVPWLNAARSLHIGRNSTFGCGKIDVVFW